MHSDPTASVSEADGIQFMRRLEYQWRRTVRMDSAHRIALPEADVGRANDESTRRRKSTGWWSIAADSHVSHTRQFPV